MSSEFSEDKLVEQPIISLVSQLGYATANCFYGKGTAGDTDPANRWERGSAVALENLASKMVDKRIEVSESPSRTQPACQHSLPANTALKTWPGSGEAGANRCCLSRCDRSGPAACRACRGRPPSLR